MPLFITASRENKLDDTDAKFVDVIHTNALLQGKIERCGHADFYMNGGIVQPGCFSGGSKRILSIFTIGYVTEILLFRCLRLQSSPIARLLCRVHS